MPHKTRAEYNTYMRKYMLHRYYKLREHIINLLGGKCKNCGSDQNLEIDHVDPKAKSFAVSVAWSQAIEKTLEETEKCQLLCKTCHTDKHRTKHSCGTPQKYWSGCHCQLCRKANADHNREYKRIWRKKRRCS